MMLKSIPYRYSWFIGTTIKTMLMAGFLARIRNVSRYHDRRFYNEDIIQFDCLPHHPWHNGVLLNIGKVRIGSTFCSTLVIFVHDSFYYTVEPWITWIFKAGSAQLPAFWFGIEIAIKRVWVGGLEGMGKVLGVCIWGQSGMRWGVGVRIWG